MNYYYRYQPLVKPKDCGNYLVLKFLDTVYQCERRKLQKLVIIADFIFYLMYEKHMIPLSDISATTKGLAIAKLSDYPYDNVFNSTNNRGHIIDNSEFFNGKYNLVAQYNYDANALNEHNKECLDKAFKHFGAYSGEDITYITKATSLWKECRNNDTETLILPITENKYCKFVYKFLYDASGTKENDKIDMAIENLISYLKGLCAN